MFKFKWPHGGGETEGGKCVRGTDQIPVLVGHSLNESGIPLYLKMQVILNVKESHARQIA